MFWRTREPAYGQRIIWVLGLLFIFGWASIDKSGWPAWTYFLPLVLPSLLGAITGIMVIPVFLVLIALEFLD